VPTIPTGDRRTTIWSTGTPPARCSAALPRSAPPRWPAHASALLTGAGTTTIVLADLREPEAILKRPAVAELIESGQPAALLLVAIAHFLTDAEDPARIIATLRDALPPGSYLALSHATGDFRAEAAAVIRHSHLHADAAQPRRGDRALQRLRDRSSRRGPAAAMAAGRQAAA
jgi:hypothetical protein